MAANNTVTEIGRLTGDAQRRAEGFVTFAIAVDASYKRKDSGERVQRTHFFDVVFRGRRAEACLPYLAKGRMVAVTGELEQNVWTDKAGARRAQVRIAVTDIDFLPVGKAPKELTQVEKVQLPARGKAVTTFTPTSYDDIPF